MTLRVLFASAAACVALTSLVQAADMQPVLKAPAAVDQQATGYVEVYSGWASTRATTDEFGSGRFNGWALGGAGRGNYWVSRDMSRLMRRRKARRMTNYAAVVISRATAIWLAATGAGAIRSSTCSVCSAE
jgi:opacity protein-like surface antigen